MHNRDLLLLLQGKRWINESQNYINCITIFLSWIIYARGFFIFSEMHIIAALTINFIVAGFICFMFFGEKEGLERKKRNLNIKCGFIINTGRNHNKNISNYSMLINNTWSFYPMTFKFCAIVNNTLLSSRATKRCSWSCFSAAAYLWRITRKICLQTLFLLHIKEGSNNYKVNSHV